MSDSFLDHLSPHEREKIRKKMRSPEAYERLREKVKGPEDLERELEYQDRMADLYVSLESDPGVQERLRTQVERDMKEQGFEQIFDTENKALYGKNLKFRLTVSAHPKTHEDVLTAVPEGNVQEKIPMKPGASEKYVAEFIKKDK